MSRVWFFVDIPIDSKIFFLTRKLIESSEIYFLHDKLTIGKILLLKYHAVKENLKIILFRFIKIIVELYFYREVSEFFSLNF